MKLVPHYNYAIVLFSFAIAFLGSYVAICLCEQLRASFLHGEKGKFIIRMKWLISIGISLGGVGIWCMHFIGMSALSLKDPITNEEIKTGYEPVQSLFSLIVVIILGGIGISIASNDRLFAKSKGEILEMFVTDNHHLTMSEIKRTKDSQIIWLISTKELWVLIAGGLCAAGGVCVMHYMGMAAMQFSDKVTIRWNPGIVFISCIIAIVAATAAFWILFRLLSIFPMKESLRLASAIIMGIAVCGMHYTGMVAADFIYDPDHSNQGNYTPNHLKGHDLIPVALAAFLVLWILTIVIFADLRRTVMKYRGFILHSRPIAESRAPTGSYLGNIMEDGVLSMNKVKPLSHSNASHADGTHVSHPKNKRNSLEDMKHDIMKHDNASEVDSLPSNITGTGRGSVGNTSNIKRNSMEDSKNILNHDSKSEVDSLPSLPIFRTSSIHSHPMSDIPVPKEDIV